MKILVSYRGIPQSPGWATGDMVVKAFRALGHEAYPYAKFYQENRWVEPRPMLDEHEWDLILFMECNDGDPQYPELRITRARKTACWLFDTSYHENRYRWLVNYFCFNHIFLANPLTVQEYKVWGYDNTHYLPYACDRDLHGRPLEYSKSRDVALVGSIRDDRIALARSLSGYGINLELIGGVFREQYIDALASSKIVINQNPEAGRGLLNMRHFEAQAAGCILLEQWNDLLVNIEAGFESFSERYTHTSDLCNRIEVALRQTVNPVLHKAFLQTHTYDNRCRTILKTIFPNERI